MSILDVTEDQIFKTLGKGKDPNFKPIEKVRPKVTRPEKSPVSMQTRRTLSPKPTMRIAGQVQPLQKEAEPVESVPAVEVDETMKKLTLELSELNTRVSGVQSMVKWFIVPQFVVVLVLIVVLFIRL
jgi:hypothetical protein